jgi:hypothetical protein
VFVGFLRIVFSAMIPMWTGSEKPHRENYSMHDLLIALAFIGMIIVPALVAAKSGGKAAGEESE